MNGEKSKQITKDLIKKIDTYLEKNLPEKRYRHIKRVAETAQKLADAHCQNDYDKQRAVCAAYLHDAGRVISKKEMLSFLNERRYNFSEDSWKSSKSLLHAPVGYYISKELFGVNDDDILNAVVFHTTGTPGMGLIEKIVYAADYLEPGRGLPGNDELLNEACADLNNTLIKIASQKACYVLQTGRFLSIETVRFYNELIEDKNEHGD